MQNLTKAEKELQKKGFILTHTEYIKIDSETSLPVITYSRYLDDEHIQCDMTITFNTSQDSIDFSSSYGTVFIEPDLLPAIQLRANELFSV
ncbi:MAG: hypothetical protein K5851_03005 [Lachnospiraceae bacterium]|nr:hypothetical protein [Lachnospiraceae bacterium]